jgi:hypothetical protein
MLERLRRLHALLRINFEALIKQIRKVFVEPPRL